MSPVSRGISFHESFLYSLYRLVDAAVICVTIYLAVGQNASTSAFVTVSAATVLTFHFASEISGLYRSWRGSQLRREIGCVVLTWCHVVPVLMGIGFLTRHNADFTYEAKLIWVFASPLALVMHRITLRTIQQRFQARGFNVRRVAICGVNELGVQLARNLERSPEMGLRLAGFFDDRPGTRTVELPHDVGCQIGGVDELLERARRGDIDIVYITFPMRAEERIRDLLAKLADATASVYIVPDFFVFELLHARWTNINGLPAVSVFENPLHGAAGLTKRVTDIVASSFILAAAAVPMMLIGAVIKLTSKGPVFFRQRRYGLDGREILVWKFRTMTCCDDGGSVQQATRNDKRVTSIGRVLRKTSLDEIPQLFNVIGGSMSLVGPRPHATAHNEQFRSLIDGYMLRHKVKPGITGLAQVNGHRGETETLDKMERRVACDHQYIREWSLWMDAKILLKTFGVVLMQQNAY